jgi:hypothetical protein
MDDILSKKEVLELRRKALEEAVNNKKQIIDKKILKYYRQFMERFDANIEEITTTDLTATKFEIWIIIDDIYKTNDMEPLLQRICGILILKEYKYEYKYEKNWDGKWCVIFTIYLD